MMLTAHPVLGQGMGGLLVSDRSGIDRSQVNPASLSMTKNYLEFTFLGAHLFAQTNVAYVPRSEFSYPGLMDQVNQLLNRSPFGQQDPPEFFIRQSGSREKHLYLQTRIAGPAMMLSLNRHSFAIGQALRMNTSGDRMPHDIVHAIFEGSPPIPDRTYRHETPVSATSMAWAEWFVSYSTMLRNDREHQLSAGVTLKWLRGIHGFYIRSEVVEYENRGGTANRFIQLRAEAGASLPLDYQTNRFLLGDQVFLANGYGVDIGLLYARPLNRRRPIARAGRAYRSGRLCDQDYSPYKFRAGLSVTDLGAIFFNQNTRQLAFDDVSSSFDSEFNAGTDAGIDGLIDETARYFSVSRDDLVTNQDFQIGLPAAVNLQIDYLLAPNWYVHALAMHPIPRKGIAIQQSAYLSVIPRFENDWIGLSAPLSVYAKRFVRVGLALRIWNLTVGIDGLRSSLGLGDVRGLGFYFSLQLGFQKGNCRKGRGWMPDCTIYE